MHLGARQREHQQGPIFGVTQRRVDQLDGRQVAPLEILQHQHQRLRGALGGGGVAWGDCAETETVNQRIAKGSSANILFLMFSDAFISRLLSLEHAPRPVPAALIPANRKIHIDSDR